LPEDDVDNTGQDAAIADGDAAALSGDDAEPDEVGADGPAIARVVDAASFEEVSDAASGIIGDGTGAGPLGDFASS
jgi:hypothetical protein